MSDEDVKVGNFNKAPKRALPGKKAVESSDGEVTAEVLNEKMDTIIKFMQAIDWKMWVYLKANNYID